MIGPALLCVSTAGRRTNNVYRRLGLLCALDSFPARLKLSGRPLFSARHLCPDTVMEGHFLTRILALVQRRVGTAPRAVVVGYERDSSGNPYTCMPFCRAAPLTSCLSLNVTACRKPSQVTHPKTRQPPDSVSHSTYHRHGPTPICNYLTVVHLSRSRWPL